MQTLLISYEDSIDKQFSLLDYWEELEKILVPTETLMDTDAIKEKVMERVVSGKASLIHFLGHAYRGGKPMA